MKTNVKDINFKLFSGSPVVAYSEEERESRLIDSGEVVNKNTTLLQDCNAYWTALQDFRDRRERSRRYYRGDQWHELMDNPDTGEVQTEEAYIQSQGKVPFKQNVIRMLVRNILGQYRKNPSKSIVVSRTREDAELSEMLTNALQSALTLNKSVELDIRALEEFIVSGAVLQKICYKYWGTRNCEDIFIENVNINRMFCNQDISDIRLTDMNLIGVMHDLTLMEVITAFARNSKDAEKIKSWYTDARDMFINTSNDTFGPDNIENIDFYTPIDMNKCRVFEIWKLGAGWRTYAHDTVDGTYQIVPYTMAEIDQFNKQRIKAGTEAGLTKDQIPLIYAEQKYDQFWYVKFITQQGYTLYEGETPYKHQEHPFALLLYPLLDGEVWGFVEDLIDQQRYINRLISLLDFIMGSAAKGVLLVPKGAIPSDSSPEEFAQKWSSFNSVILYEPKPGVPVPQQVSANSTNLGAKDLLTLQMQLLNEIAGISPASLGQQSPSGTPSSLYAQQAQNSSINIADLLGTFSSFREGRDAKVLKTLMQFYKEKRFIGSAGKSYSESAKRYDPERVKDVDVDIITSQGIDTPVYRQIMDDFLFNLYQAKAIDVEMMLENSSMPFADKILQRMKSKQQQMQQQPTPEQMAAIQQGAIQEQGVTMELPTEAQNLINQAKQIQ